MKGCLSAVIALIVAGLAALVVSSGVCFMGINDGRYGRAITCIKCDWRHNDVWLASRCRVCIC